MKRRIFFGTAAVVALSSVLSIGPIVSPAHADAKKFTIALIPGLTTDAFYITMRKGAQAAADALGVTLGAQIDVAGAATTMLSALVTACFGTLESFTWTVNV